MFWPGITLDLKPEVLFRTDLGSSGFSGTGGLGVEANAFAGSFELRLKGAAWVDLQPQTRLLEGYFETRTPEYRLTLGKLARYSGPWDATPFGLEGAWGVYGLWTLQPNRQAEGALMRDRAYIGLREGPASLGAFVYPGGYSLRVGFAGENGSLFWQSERGFFGNGKLALDAQNALEGQFWWLPEQKLLFGLAYNYADQLKIGFDLNVQPVSAYRLWLEVWAR